MAIEPTGEELSQAFDAPVQQILAAIFAATLNPKERAGLALIITSKFVGATCRIVQENDPRLKAMEMPDVIRALGNMMAGMVERDGLPRQ